MAYNFLFLVQGQRGTGRHIWDVRVMDTVDMAKVWNVPRRILLAREA